MTLKGDERRRLLRKSALLSVLTEEQLAELAPHVAMKQFSESQTIVEDGDPGDGMYIVNSGSVAISTLGHEGRTRVSLAIMGPGQCFGEMALLDQQPRSATVTALAPTTCLFLPASTFTALLERDATVARALLPILSQRLRDTNKWIQALL